jgi:hypothetical protein
MNTNKVYESHTSIRRENVEQVLLDKDGNLKQLFTENRLGQFLLSVFRSFVPDPIDESGQVKRGLKNYLSAYGLRIPMLTGSWGYSRHLSNGITNAGRALISGLINGSGSPAAATYVAVGTGTNAFSASDTTLQTESSTSGLSRAAGTVSLVTTSVTNDTAQVLKSFSVSGTVAVTEAGLLNASSSGTLLARQTFSAVNVVSGDTLQITWKVQNA